MIYVVSQTPKIFLFALLVEAIGSNQYDEKYTIHMLGSHTYICLMCNPWFQISFRYIGNTVLGFEVAAILTL